jgi:hypothetical protein
MKRANNRNEKNEAQSASGFYKTEYFSDMPLKGVAPAWRDAPLSVYPMTRDRKRAEETAKQGFKRSGTKYRVVPATMQEATLAA